MYTFDIDQIYAGLALRIKQCIVIENPKTLKILPFYRKCTRAWPKIRKLWGNKKNVSGGKRQFQDVLLK